MATADFLFDCLESIRELKPEPDKFEQTICSLCKNMDCVRAGKGDRFAKRVASQPDRFFNPEQADPKSSRYAGLADFEDRLAQEMIRAIANRRGDWVMPEILTLDGKVDQTTNDMVEDAVAALPLPPQTEAPEEEPEEPEEPVAPPVKAPLPTPAGKVHRPLSGNTSMPAGGIMIGGGPAPKAPEAVDPWAPPVVTRPTISKPGARIQFGSDGTVTVTPPTETKKP